MIVVGSGVGDVRWCRYYYRVGYVCSSTGAAGAGSSADGGGDGGDSGDADGSKKTFDEVELIPDGAATKVCVCVYVCVCECVCMCVCHCGQSCAS